MHLLNFFDRLLKHGVLVSTALYRRYRPESFADVIGQEHVTEPLMTALEKNRVNHAYLFSGPRGCGKTTSARILARCLNCAQGPTPTPCGTCESCRDLSRDGGGSLDVIEMDAASHGGVDHARDLRERASFAPVRDRYKIFIIDEAHMVTREGFNALLKIVEEPPPHIKFIFATTEPHKVLGTIRSRTHHYPFRLVPPETLHNYLARLCQEEGVQVQPGVLQLVVRAGGGSVRDSLSILDQLMAGASTEGISYDLAVALLGFTHGELLDGLVDALAQANAPAVFEAVNTAIQSGQDPRRFVEDLLERFRDLLMLQAVPEASRSVLRGMPEAQLQSMRTQAERLTTADVTRAAEITSDALNQMNGATSPQLTLELMCARIMLAASEADTQALGSRLDKLEKRLDSGNFAVPSAGVSRPGQDAVAQVSQAPAGQDEAAQVRPLTQPVQTVRPDSQPPAPLQEAPLAGLRRPTQQAPVQPAQPAPVQAPPLAPQAPSQQVPPAQPAPVQPEPAQPAPHPASRNLVELAKTNWQDVLARVPSPTARHWFAQCTPSKFEEGQLFIRATMDVLKMVKPHIDELAAAIAQVLEIQVRIRGELDKTGAPATPQATQASPAQQEAQPAQQAPQVHPAASAPQAPAPQPVPVAEGPRGGEQAWEQHGQPRTQEAPRWSTDDWNNPVTSWNVAQIPSDDAAEGQQVAEAGAPAGQQAASALVSQEESAPFEVAAPVAEAPRAEEVPEAVAVQEAAPAEVVASAPVQEAPVEASDSREFPEEPYEPYEDREYIAGQGYVEPAQEIHPAQETGPVQGGHPAQAQVSQPPLAGGSLPPLAQAPASAQVAPEPSPVEEAPAAAPLRPGQRLSFRERHAAEIAAGARAAQPLTSGQETAEVEDFVPSDEDTALEETVLIGQRAVEKVLGGIVIDERPLHSN